MKNIDDIDAFGFEVVDEANEYKRQANLLVWGVIIILIGVVFSLLCDEIVSYRDEIVEEYNETVSDFSIDDFFDNYGRISSSSDRREKAQNLKRQIKVYDFLVFMGEKGCYILMFVGGIMIISAQIRRANEK